MYANTRFQDKVWYLDSERNLHPVKIIGDTGWSVLVEFDTRMLEVGYSELHYSRQDAIDEMQDEIAFISAAIEKAKQDAEDSNLQPSDS